MDKYEEALKRAREIYNAPVATIVTRTFLEQIFPELKESEDEKIRKAINLILIATEEDQDAFYRTHNLTRKECSAWLEKQKENPKSAKSIPLNCVSDVKWADRILTNAIVSLANDVDYNRSEPLRYKQEIDDLKKLREYLEKQKEQKPSAVEVLNSAGLKTFRDGNQWCALVGDNIQEGICGFGDTIDEALYEFLKEVLSMANSPQLKEQKPAEWDFPYGENETVDKLIAIAECLEMDGDCLFNGYTGTECGKFLRDLARKQVECKPAEWSEEDEKILDRLILRMDGHHFTYEVLQAMKHWLIELKKKIPRQEGDYAP